MCTTQEAKQFYLLVFPAVSYLTYNMLRQTMASPSTIMLTCRLVVVSETAFASTHTAMQQSKGKTTHRINLTSLPEFDGCAGESGDKASWLVKVVHLFRIDTIFFHGGTDWLQNQYSHIYTSQTGND